MGKTGFEKATSKMFGDFGTSVRIAQSGGGERLSREDRERLRREAEGAAQEQKSEEQQRQLIKTLVDMKVIPASTGADVPEEGTVRPAEKPGAATRQGRGRPLKDPEVGKYVLLNFRIPEELRTRLKVLSAELGVTMIELFEEGLDLVMQKYGRK